jgi:hypothetical protein
MSHMGRCVTQSYLRITACGAAILPDTKADDFHSRIGTTAPEIESVPADEPEHPLLLNTSADNSAKSKGVICPIALCRARGSYLPHSPAQPKHDSRPRALGCRFLTKLRFQAALEYLGVGFLVYCRGGVQEHGSNRSQFSANGFSRPRTVAYWHLPLPDRLSVL